MKHYVLKRMFFIHLLALTISLPAFFCGATSDNFITRWAFQDMCDHVFDPRTSMWASPTSTIPGGIRCNPDDIQPGDLVFVRDIELFMKVVHPEIK